MTHTVQLADLERASDLMSQVDESGLDFAPDLVFGLGDSNKVEQVVILRPDGSSRTINSPGRSITLSIEN